MSIQTVSLSRFSGVSFAQAPAFKNNPMMAAPRFTADSSTPPPPKKPGRLKRAMQVGYSLALLGAGFYGGAKYDDWTEPAPTQVVRVKDGDTFVMANEKEVRIYGMDAPETGQPFADAAKSKLEKLILGKTVTLTGKGSNFGRKIAVVEVGTLDVGGEMVRLGLAYEEPHHAKGEYKPQEAEARKEKRGVWTLPGGGVRPWEYRKNKAGKAAVSDTPRKPLGLVLMFARRPEEAVFIPWETVTA